MQVDNRQAQSVQITQVVAKFGNIENSKEIMEKKGFIVIKSDYITWFYVAQIMSGEKSLLKSEQLHEFVIPPRLVNQICKS